MTPVLTEILGSFGKLPAGIALLWIFSAGVSALDPPYAGSNPWYRWLYQFLHLLAANLDKAGLLRTGAGSARERA